MKAEKILVSIISLKNLPVFFSEFLLLLFILLHQSFKYALKGKTAQAIKIEVKVALVCDLLSRQVFLTHKFCFD
jgi:hypothetical protein